jgi:orotate phosphoribosyltransferase
MNKSKLIALFKSTKNCISTGNFKLSSGSDSKYYIDSKQITLSSTGLKLLGDCFLYLIKTHTPYATAIGGMTIGADMLVSACIMVSDLSGFIIRKEPKSYGKTKQIEGPPLDNHKIILIEDVTTTGATLLKSAKIIENEVNQKVTDAFTIVDREFGAATMLKQNGINLHSILTSQDLGINEKV